MPSARPACQERYLLRHLGAHLWDVCPLHYFGVVAGQVGTRQDDPDRRFDPSSGLHWRADFTGCFSIGYFLVPARCGLEFLFRRRVHAFGGVTVPPTEFAPAGGPFPP